MNDEPQKILKELLESATKLLEVCAKVNNNGANPDMYSMYAPAEETADATRALIIEMMIKYADRIQVTWKEERRYE